MVKSSLKIICMLLVLSHHAYSKVFDALQQPEDLDVMYPNNVHNERGLRECPAKVACNILHKRFWYQIRVERLCQCPDFQECPAMWSNASLDNFTMPVNNRAQLKFCEPLNELPTCSSKEIALKITSNTTSSPDKYNRNQNIMVTHQHATAVCQCQFPSYWKLHNVTYVNRNISINNYICAELKKCISNEFCGHIRADHYSSYYQCSCPKRHMCLFENRNLHNVTEIMYEGLAYRGICKLNKAKISKVNMHRT